MNILIVIAGWAIAIAGIRTVLTYDVQKRG